MSPSPIPPRPLPEIDMDETSYTQSGTVHLSAFSPPIRSINPLLPLSIIHPISDQAPRATTPRLIPSATPLTPYPHDHPSPPDGPHQIPGRRGSPAPSSGGSLTVRPALLGSNQSTLKPLLPPLLSPPGWNEASGNTGGKSWQETDSRTARQPERPHWIGSLGEVKMVDELEVEMCVLCGRAMGRSEIEVKEFDLAGGASGQHATSSGTAVADGEGASKGGVEEMMQGLGLGVGRWMVCRDTAGCDAAVEKATFADDEDE